MTLKASIAKRIPLPILNGMLLTFPFLYNLKSINYESYLDESSIKELTVAIDNVKDISGEIIECGSARCGTSCILANYIKKHNLEKILFALDSFEGFDSNELTKENELGLTVSEKNDFTYTSIDYVTEKIKKLNLSDFIVPVKGYFEDTLPKINSNFCLGFIDCDLQESMEFAAEQVWEKLSPGGMLYFDDYESEAYKGVKLAVDKFVTKHKNEISEHGIINRLYHICKIAK